MSCGTGKGKAPGQEKGEKHPEMWNGRDGRWNELVKALLAHRGFAAVGRESLEFSRGFRTGLM